jgi:hypothetical protein
MKVYEVIVSDFDLYGEYGLYKNKEKAEARKEELSKGDMHWKKYLKIVEKEVIE